MKEKIIQAINERLDELIISDVNIKTEIIQSYLDEYEDLKEKGMPTEEAYMQIINKIDDLNILTQENIMYSKKRIIKNSLISIINIFIAFILNTTYIITRQSNQNNISILFYVFINLIILIISLFIFLVSNKNNIYDLREKGIYKLAIISFITNLLIFVPSILIELCGSSINIKEYLRFSLIPILLLINLYRVIMKDIYQKYYHFINIVLVLAIINSIKYNNIILSIILYSIVTLCTIVLLFKVLISRLSSIYYLKVKILSTITSLFLVIGIWLLLPLLSTNFDLNRIIIFNIITVIVIISNINIKMKYLNNHIMIFFLIFCIDLFYVKTKSIFITIFAQGYNERSIIFLCREISIWIGIIILIIFLENVSKCIYKIIRKG